MITLSILLIGLLGEPESRASQLMAVLEDRSASASAKEKLKALVELSESDSPDTLVFLKNLEAYWSQNLTRHEAYEIRYLRYSLKSLLKMREFSALAEQSNPENTH